MINRSKKSRKVRITMRSKRKAMRNRHVKSGLIQFERNGRWGTCSGCPVDNNDLVRPELCQFTQRYDHKLTKADLYSLWERTKKEHDRNFEIRNV